MKADERDLAIIEKILSYCRQIEDAHTQFGRDRERFFSNTVYHNAVALCILQIGELTNHISEDFKAAHAGIPWKSIRGMRNLVAHEYGNLDTTIIWETATEDIVQLQRFCETVINEQY